MLELPINLPYTSNLLFYISPILFLLCSFSSLLFPLSSPSLLLSFPPPPSFLLPPLSSFSLPSLPPLLSPFRVDSLQQTKARLEVANQTLRQQHQKEMEGRDDDAEQLKASMQKKVKSLTQQLEELHEEKQAAVKVCVLVRWRAACKVCVNLCTHTYTITENSDTFMCACAHVHTCKCVHM